MTNPLTTPQKMPLRQYFAKTLILQGFRPPKNINFSPFLTHFLSILEALSPSPIIKKRRNLYIFYVLKPYPYFL